LKVIKKTYIFFSFIIFTACGTTATYDTGYSGLFERWARLDSGARERRSARTSRTPTSVSGLSSRELKTIRKTVENFQWPLEQVFITSHFGKRGGRDHEGTDFRASVGTPVYASGAGEVVYSGSRISGYGRMVVLKHPNNLFTVYAHHQKNLVRVGQKIKQGQKIAYSGRSGRVTGPHLHFELRYGSLPLNPVEFMRPIENQTPLALKSP